MTRLLKEINTAAATNDLTRLYFLGRIEFSISGKHLRGLLGKIVHQLTGV